MKSFTHALCALFILVSFNTTHAMQQNAPKGQVIITHGFLGKNYEWYKKGGCFHEAVKAFAKNKNYEVVSFSWNQPFGGASHREQKNAGRALANHIWNLDPSLEVIIVAHSYGGLVSFRASQFLHKFQCAKTHKPISRIKALYTLGTPHGPRDPKPNMEIIEHLYNLNSIGDFIANVVAGSGALPFTIKQHNNATNLYVELPGSGLLGKGYPGHSEIHHKTIGQSILAIPKLVKDYRNGTLTFHPDKEPCFKPELPKTPSLLLPGLIKAQAIPLKAKL